MEQSHQDPDLNRLKLGTGQPANLLKKINKTVGTFNITKQMTITRKWHGCHFKNLIYACQPDIVETTFRFAH